MNGWKTCCNSESLCDLHEKKPRRESLLHLEKGIREIKAIQQKMWTLRTLQTWAMWFPWINGHWEWCLHMTLDTCLHLLVHTRQKLDLRWLLSANLVTGNYRNSKIHLAQKTHETYDCKTRALIICISMRLQRKLHKSTLKAIIMSVLKKQQS